MTDPVHDTARLDAAIASLRDAVERRLGAPPPEPVDNGAASVVRFADDLPAELPAQRRAELLERANALRPWLQGPFHLGGDLTIGGPRRDDRRWEALGPELPADLSGVRILDVGSNAGYDPFMFARRGATDVLACEPGRFLEQARFLEEIYRTGVAFEPLQWEDLDPGVHGTFDLVHCHGVLHREIHPMALLQRLRSLLADGGTLLLGSLMLADPELSEYARFVPGSSGGDEPWWWVPGRLCLRWMIEAAGCEVTAELGLRDGPPGTFPVIDGYLRALPRSA